MTTGREFAVQLHDTWRWVQEQLAVLRPAEIESGMLRNGWTVKATMAHMAFWDDFQRRRMEAALSGASAANGFAYPDQDNDQRAAQDQTRPWPEVQAAANTARDRLVAFAASLDDDVLARDYPEGARTLSLAALLEHMVHHTIEHGSELLAYAGSWPRWGRADLRAYLVERHTDLLAAVQRMDSETAHTAAVCGRWSARDVLAHVAGWHALCTDFVEEWPHPAQATIDRWAWLPDEDLDAYNARMLAAMEGMDLPAVVAKLESDHARLLACFDDADDAAMESEGRVWRDSKRVLSTLFTEVGMHQAEHAAQIWAYGRD